GLAPADRKLYALRDITGTVEAIPLIASSIMSKKIAEGTAALTLDVKTGAGAFMKDEADARELARTMVELGTDAGVRTVALLTDMSAPLGRTAGNGLEVRESLEVLAGGGPADVVELTCALAREMLEAPRPGRGRRRAAAGAGARRGGPGGRGRRGHRPRRDGRGRGRLAARRRPFPPGRGRAGRGRGRDRGAHRRRGPGRGRARTPAHRHRRAHAARDRVAHRVVEVRRARHRGPAAPDRQGPPRLSGPAAAGAQPRRLGPEGPGAEPASRRRSAGRMCWTISGANRPASPGGTS